MSSGRVSQNSHRQNRKPKRDSSPLQQRKEKNELRRNRPDNERQKSELDLAKLDEGDREKDRDRKNRKDNNVSKQSKRTRSPRRISKELDRKANKREVKITRNESKDKLKDKKSPEVAERHPLFQDNSRLAQLIAQITGAQEESTKRLSASQQFLEYIYDVTHIEPLKRNCSSIFSALEEVFRERGHNELKDKIVKCYASIGHVLGIDCDKFFQWVFSKIPSAANDQLRVLYLRTIAEAVKLDVGNQVFYGTMPMIMACLQDVLENADSPELLLVLLDVLKIIARDYPHIFAEYFRDTVDILVGWHIDTSQNEELTNNTADCLISFHPYWVSYMRFSLTLLGQFLEDMEAYAEELSCINHGKISKEDAPSPFVSLPKLTALTRVFTTVVSGLGEFFSPGREAKITTTYISETVERIISCVDICGYDLKFEKLLIAANSCLAVLVTSLGHSISISCLKVVRFVNAQLVTQCEVTYNLSKSALNLLEKVVVTVGQDLPAEVIKELFEKNKPLMKIRSIADSDLLSVVLNVFQSLLSIKNIPLLEKIYKYFVEDLQETYKVLMKSCKNSSTNAISSTSITTNDMIPTSRNEHERDIKAYSQLVFDLAALTEIVTFKSSVTGAWKVEPSTFTILTQILDPTDKQLAEKYPAIQFSILSTLFCHSQRCNNFIPSSKTKTIGHSGESLALISLLCKILSDGNNSADVKKLCAIWLCDIANSIAALPMDIQKQQWDLLPAVDTFISLSYDIENSVREEIVNCITSLTKTGLVHCSALSRLLAEVLIHLTDVNKDMNLKFRKMILLFPADLIASLPTVSAEMNTLKPSTTQASSLSTKDLWLFCKRHMSRTPMGTLHSYSFRIVMDYLLDVHVERDLDMSWLETVYSSCQRVGKINEPNSGDWSLYQNLAKSKDATFPTNTCMNGFILSFWMTWEAAEFCVLSRLKTPIGKASDTFQTIEGAIKDVELKFRESRKIKIFNDASKNEPKLDYSIVQRAVLLLQFHENLEKLMYNAYEGTAASLPPAIRAVRTFFRTNRSTCSEWLNRIQQSTTKLSSYCGNPEKALRNGFLWLQHLKTTGNTQGTEYEHAMVTVVDAFIQLHCSEGILGLLEWSKKVVGRDLYWLYGSISKAKGSLEIAAQQFKTGLHNYLSPDRLKSENVNEVKKATVTVLTKDPIINAESQTTQFFVAQITDCYLQLCDWSEVQEWSKEIANIRSKFHSVQGLNLTIDHSYVKAMMKFEEHDFAGVHEQLENIPGATMTNMLQEQFPVLGTVKEDKDSRASKEQMVEDNVLDDKLTPQAMLCKSRIYLMQALTLYWTSGLNTLKGSRVGSLHSSAWETVDKLLSQACTTALVPFQSMLVNGTAQSKAPFLMQLKSIEAIRETLMVTNDEDQLFNSMFMNVYGRTHYLDAENTDISILNESLRTASYLQFHHSLHKKGWVGPSTASNHKVPNIQTLQVLTAKLARKQGNKKLAESLLAKQLSLLESKGAVDGKMYLTSGAQLRLKQLSASVNSGKVVDPLAAVDILKESAKLKITLGFNTEAIDVLCSSILLSERQILSVSNKTSNNIVKLSEVSSRSFVTLAKWLLKDTKVLSPTSENEESVVIGPKVREVIKLTNKSGGSVNKLIQSLALTTSMPESAIVCGQLLHHSTNRCPSLGKTWFAYADWCYKWGRKIVEQEHQNGSVALLEEERDAVMKLLPKSTPKNTVEKVLSILGKAHYIKEPYGGGVDENFINTDSEGLNESDEKIIQRQLRVTFGEQLNDAIDVTVDSLVTVWRGILNRVFTHYKQATTSYFTYLKLSGSKSYTPADVLRRTECGNITATLRLLRLLVKYPNELKEHLEDPFSQTPTKPWKGIIPQLFARLNHPDKYIQSRVANLLCRIAKDSPQLIVYPTVVGCSDMMSQQHLTKSSAEGILRAYQFEGDDECEQPVEAVVESQDIVSQTDILSSQDDAASVSADDTVMQSSLHVILDTLNEDNPTLVQEVKCVVQELRRITLLWDELWLGSLTQLHQEAQRRITQLENEILRVNSNQNLSDNQKTSLIKEKHMALMKPLIYSLERLQNITNQQPETPHEKSFQDTFTKRIDNAINSLKNPNDPSKPNTSWDQARQLYQSLQSRSQKRPVANLMMSDASPILADSKFELIPLPGIECVEDKMISLRSFTAEIQILPTKTKPKKLVMNGKDGQRYPYLFKGLEDLHLDERIMQFLEICNHMFAKNDRSGEKMFVARHYSVTPLGPRSGLIQWVDGSTPLFTLYRKWQQREAATNALLKSQADKNQTVTVPATMRPTELFFSKINPIFKEKGIDSHSPRKDWPMAILKKVLQELSNETPADLLSREFWCASINAASWWKITQSYSRSVAVMSMIGYVIGLGDRHLDNILVDLNTGEVVHIDYNVCFEKGRMLRVPERVPFRMTRNMETALGITGVEGIFRSACEKTMTTLRQGRETLLTLLEAFVYDPLIDWTTANDGAFAGAFYGGGGGGADEGNKFSRKEIERNITQTLLSTRVAEMQISWTDNKDDLGNSLNKLKILMEQYCKTLNSQWFSHEELQHLQHQITILKSALAKSDHPLHTLQSRYDKQARLLEAFKYWKDKMTEKLSEADQMLVEFQNAFMKIKGNHIATLYTEVSKLAEVGSPSYGPAVSFLKSAGQSNIVKQCELTENELSSVLHQRRVALRNCIEAFLTYSSIVNQFSLEYTNHASLGTIIPMLNILLVEPSSANCKEKLKEYQNILKIKESVRKDFEPLVVTLENKLDHYFTEQNSKMIKLCERRGLESTETPALSRPVTETWNALRKFVGDSGGSGTISLACVTVTALTTLNKRQLVMENAAAVANERLMHLTSRDGDWFLDELCTMCGNISQLLSVLKNNPIRAQFLPKNSQTTDIVDDINIGMNIVFAAVKAYNSLQELMSNFRTIIVPEAANCFLKNDPSVLYIAEAIKDLIANSPLSLKTLSEKIMSAIKNKSEVPGDVMKSIDKLKNVVDQFIEPQTEEIEPGETSVMNPGQMLLAGFSGLFTKVEGELNVLYEYFRKLKVPDGLDHLDMQQEQKNLKSSKMMSNSKHNKWMNLLFTKKLTSIHAFFEACSTQSNATRDIDHAVRTLNATTEQEMKLITNSMPSIMCVFNEELLSLSVKQFIAECVQSFIIGLPSHAVTALSLNYVHLLSASNSSRDKKGTLVMEDLCKKMVEANLKSTSFPHQHLSQASGLINSHDVAWRKHDLARRLDGSINTQKEIVQRAQLQLVRFQWLHDDVCVSNKKRSQGLATPTKSTIISDIKKKMHAINKVEQGIPALMERYTQLQSSIEQRLKWASGANPALNVVMKNFAQAASERKAMLMSESKLTPEVLSVANALVAMESFRQNPKDAEVFEQAVVTIVQKSGESSDTFESCMGDLGDVEQFMNSLKISIPPSEPITIDWMKSRLSAVEGQIKSIQEQEPSLKGVIQTDKDHLKSQVSSVKSCLTAHHALVGEVKSMLKTLAKDEEAEECLQVRKFIQLHNKFSEDSSLTLKKILSVCSGSRSDISEELFQLTEEESARTGVMIDDLVNSVNMLHDHLLQFGISSMDPNPTEEENEQESNEQPTFSLALQRPAQGENAVSQENTLPEAQGDGGGLSEDTKIASKDELAVKAPPVRAALSFTTPLGKPGAMFSKKTTQRQPIRDSKNGKAYQEKNLYALNVWKRVKAKLEGKDVESTLLRVPVSEQVTCIIEEATSNENLCQLYEGWTPWV